MLSTPDVWAIFLQKQGTGEEPDTEAYHFSTLTRAAWALGAILLPHALSPSP
jgi:hypothetical protein